MRRTPPYTVSKLLRWRVKVWVSCFYTCNFPLAEESEAKNPRMPRETAIVKSKVGTSKKKAKEEAESSSRRRRRRVVGKKKLEEGQSVRLSKENGSEAGRTSFAENEEDYIVFCFRDDGEIDHVLLPNHNNTNVQRLRLEDEAARNEKDSNGKVKGNEAAICTGDEMTEIATEEEEESGEGKEISTTASSDSNDQSDSASTGSFAFPIIEGKWIGSPVQMPRSGSVRRLNNSRIHCCRF